MRANLGQDAFLRQKSEFGHDQQVVSILIRRTTSVSTDFVLKDPQVLHSVTQDIPYSWTGVL